LIPEAGNSGNQNFDPRFQSGGNNEWIESEKAKRKRRKKGTSWQKSHVGHGSEGSLVKILISWERE